MSSLTITKAASNELLRQSIYRGTPGEIFLYLQPDILDDGWMFLRVNIWEKSGIPIARTDGITLFAPSEQLNLLQGLQLDYLNHKEIIEQFPHLRLEKSIMHLIEQHNQK